MVVDNRKKGFRSSKIIEEVEKSPNIRHYIDMSNALPWLLFIAAVYSWPSIGQELLLRQPNQLSKNQEQLLFKKKIEVLNERYKDFFIHKQRVERRRAERELGASQKRREREVAKEKQEKIRQQFVARRRAKSDISKEKLAFEAKKREQKKKKDLLRKKFVQQQKVLKDISQKAKRVPEKKMLGL